MLLAPLRFLPGTGGGKPLSPDCTFSGNVTTQIPDTILKPNPVAFHGQRLEPGNVERPMPGALRCSMVWVCADYTAIGGPGFL